MQSYPVSSSLIATSCSSVQYFVLDFLQIPPRSGDTLVLSSWFRLLRPIADSHRLANTHAGRTSSWGWEKNESFLPASLHITYIKQLLLFFCHSFFTTTTMMLFRWTWLRRFLFFLLNIVFNLLLMLINLHNNWQNNWMPFSLIKQESV